MTRPRTYLHVPGQHPVVEVGLFVEEAGEDNQSRHCVQDREHADADHQLLQFICLGTVVFHDSTDSKQGDESGQQEYSAQHQVDEQRGQDETPESVDVPQSNVADPTQDVTCDKQNRHVYFSVISVNLIGYRLNGRG